MRIKTITGLLLTIFTAVSLYEASAQPLTLVTSPYTNTFDSIEANFGIPGEWTTYTGATETAPGSVYAWADVNYTAASNTWRTVSGRFANQASTFSYTGGTNFNGEEGPAIQQAEPNRCMAIRQTGSLGDPGAAFVLKIADTLNKKDFVLSVDFDNLDPTSPRTTTWTVDYGLGTFPSSFVPVATYVNTVSNFTTYPTNITFPNGTIDNYNGIVWIRIVALAPSTGSGARETFGVDNVGLSWGEGVACTPVSITGDPDSVDGYVNGNASFTCGAVGTAPRYYQWIKNSTTVLTDDGHFSGSTTPTLSITTLQVGDAGTYTCIVSNVCGSTLYSQTSGGAELTVGAPPAVSIGYLRTLVDPTSWGPTNSSLLYTATGMITTHTNTTSGNTASYYLQDGTGGINLFCTFGSTFRPAIGDVVTAVGFLSSYLGNLELEVDLSDPANSVTILSNNIAGYPTPIAVPWDNLYQYGTNADLNYNTAGSIVLLTDVHFGANAGFVTGKNNYYWSVTNSLGQMARIIIPARIVNDLTNRTIPSEICSVQGPLLPYSFGEYEVMPTSWSEITVTGPGATPVTVSSITPTAINYTGGSGAQFVLLESTDVALALSSWTRSQTNPATPGSFTISPGGPQKFYSIKSE
jgi:hypothetical protein